MKVPHNSLILVADGNKALLLRNIGDAEILDLRVEGGAEHSDAPDRERRTDAKGRKASFNTTQSESMEGESDFHQQAENRFAADIAAELNRSALAGDLERLIVVAPPKILGELRKRYHKEVEKRLAGEIRKNLTGHAVTDIEQILQSA